MSKPSIAILGSRGIPARYGGFETFAEELSVRLAASGVEVTVFCEKDSETDEPTSFRDVALEYVPVVQLGPLTTIIFDVRCLWRARKKFDVVYMLGYGASIFCFIPRIWGSVVWINMDGIEWARSKWSTVAKVWFRLMEKAATVTATRLIADAAAIREHLVTRHKTATPISVIPYGARLVDSAPDVSALDEFQLEAGGYYLVVCRLEPENHVREIVDGFMASASPFPLLVLGDIDAPGPYTAELREIRSARVRFAGTLFDQARLESLRWHCRAYFHGHSVGGTNPSLLEALGCGNRIIAHDNPFNREVAGDCAKFFGESSEIPQIMERMDKLEATDSERKRTQDRVADFYLWSRITDAYETLLTKP